MSHSGHGSMAAISVAVGDSSSEDITARDLTVPARDGYPLAATLFRSGPRVVIINSATAVKRHFYKHFAGALAARGYTALTYDYRGIGGSKPATLRGFRALTRDWSLLDMHGVVAWARAELGAERLFLVGHSVGGQTAGLLENSDAINGMVTLSSQSGYWRLQGAEQKVTVLFHVHVTLPLLSQLFGYMPWSAISAAEDLPKGVAIEWARWCRQPNYLLDDDTLPLARYQKFRAPVLAYSFGDDKWGTRASVDAMMRAYPNLERRHVEPAEAGLPRIGHFGYFRRESSSLWHDAIEWLNAL